MIDPDNITNYHRSTPELEELVLFCCVVAGKSAHQQSKKLENFLNLHPSLREGKSPFEYIRALDEKGLLRLGLEEVKLGQYTRLEKAFRMVLDIDLSNCSPEDLEAIPGIGMKTSRFFIVHSREGAEYAILDTHILKYIREETGVSAPKQTPTRNTYLKLEEQYLEHAKKQGMSLADLDLQIWLSYRTPVKSAA